MFTWLRRVVLYRLFGGRIMLLLAVLGWLRGRVGRRETPASGYQPSQGESQIVQREPR